MGERKIMLAPWFKAKLRVRIDGAAWVTNGFLAIKAPADKSLKTVPAATLIAMIDGSTVDVTPGKREMGHVWLGDLAYQEHFIALVDSAHPGSAWRATPTRDGCGSAAAFVDGKPVGVVMCVFGYPRSVAAPPCPTCDGAKGTPCKTCDGSGTMTQVCDMGHEHDDECGACNGQGYTGKCEACDGTGEWKAAPHA